MERRYVPLLDRAVIGGAGGSASESLAVKGNKAVFSVTGADVESLATFTSDGTAAVTRRRVGRGWALFSGLMLGLAYFAPAIPRRPVARGTLDSSFNHWRPTACAAGLTIQTRACLTPYPGVMSNSR